MTALVLLFSLVTAGQFDSLYTALNKHPTVAAVLELHALHLKENQFMEAFALLRKFEELLPLPVKPRIIYALGNTYLYDGDVRQARTEYLRLIGQDPNSEIANDALERIYLIESARQDTALLKRLARCLYFHETRQDNVAEDSIRPLLNTVLGTYAHYYLALLYFSRGDFPAARAALDELGEKYPEHTIHKAPLLLAEVNIEMGEAKAAREILESIIVREPQSIYAAQAREMLLSLNSKVPALKQ